MYTLISAQAEMIGFSDGYEVVISSNRAVRCYDGEHYFCVVGVAQVRMPNSRTGSSQAGRHCCMIVARKTGTKVGAPFSAGQPRRARC